MLAQAVGARLPEGLAGRPVPGWHEPQVRLRRLGEAGLDAAIVVQPHPSAPAQVPGSGAATLPVRSMVRGGVVEWLAIERIPNTAQGLERLKAEGFWVYGTDAEGVPPWTLDLTGKVVLCLGGEEKGLRARTRQLCDHMIGLPMRGRVGSLNIATAAAAVLYDAVRQRWKR